MKFSQVLHVTSILVGLVGVIAFIGAVLGGGDGLVYGITKMDALACSAILILIAIWAQMATIHHMELEKKGKLI